MSKNLFNSVKMTKPNNNVFDLSHDVKLSCNPGELVPILCMECVPGDKINISCESLLRFAPLVSPLMHISNVFMHYFFVPNRLTWPGWEDFITNTKTAGLLPAFPFLTMPAVPGGDYTRLHDYLGIPTPDGVVTEKVSALPMAAYQMIYNEFYRDQNLITEIPFELVDGDNAANKVELGTLRQRAWEHDYLTSALPFAQKGDAVSLPLGTVELKSNWQDVGTPLYREADDDPASPGNLQQDGTPQIVSDTAITERLAYDPQGSLEVGATTINDLRRAFRLQEWLEKSARGGSRYVENILSFFGVRSSDKRLQRPEYITGTKSPVVISEVLNTTGTVDRPQGDMAGHAVSVTSGKYGSYFCEEHGYIIGIMSILPKTAYQQGMPKHFLKFEDPFQYYWPQFANIGEQEILKKEVFAYAANGGETFGYIPRYSEYKFQASRVSGQFRGVGLSHWHWGRIFAGTQSLNADFIEADPSNRIFAVTDPNVEKLFVHVLNKIRAVRPMPKYGTPQF